MVAFSRLILLGVPLLAAIPTLATLLDSDRIPIPSNSTRGDKLPKSDLPAGAQIGRHVDQDSCLSFAPAHHGDSCRIFRTVWAIPEEEFFELNGLRHLRCHLHPGKYYCVEKDGIISIEPSTLGQYSTVISSSRRPYSTAYPPYGNGNGTNTIGTGMHPTGTAITRTAVPGTATSTQTSLEVGPTEFPDPEGTLSVDEASTEEVTVYD